MPSQFHTFLPCQAAMILTLAATSFAQSHTVSPPGYATQAGNASNTYPFLQAAARYQQVHGDVRTPAMISAVALRQAQSPVRSMPARTLDVELWIGAGDHTAMTDNFTSNFVTAPTLAMQRRQVQFPDWSIAPPSSPAPWTAVLPCDQPTVIAGTGDLLWELHVHQNSHAAFYWTDAYAAQGTAEGPGGPVGTACTATGMSTPVEFDVALQARRATGHSAMDATGLYWPVNQPGVVLVGFQDPDLTLPGLCTRIRVQPLVSIHLTIGGRSNLTLPITTWPFDPNTVGLRLHIQAAALDPGQPGLPLVASTGWTGTLPDLPPVGHPIRRLQAASASAATGTLDQVSYGLITRFSH